MSLSKLIAAWKAYRAIEPWLGTIKSWFDKPWMKRVIAALGKLFERPLEQKDEQGWTPTGKKTFDNRLDPPSGGG